MDGVVSPYFGNAAADSITVDDANDSVKDKGNAREHGNGSGVILKCKPEKELLEDVPTDQRNQASCSVSTPSYGEKLEKMFYEKECTALAKALLGQVLARKFSGTIVRGIIVETESYLGGVDVASHSYNGKRTPRTEAMYMEPGTLYVYSIYGMYYCINISSQGEGSCVLIRSLEPVEGIDEMKVGRSCRRTANSRPLKLHELCNGPSKLCQALNITKDLCNKLDASSSEEIWLEKGRCVPESEIVSSKRIGIESAGREWANKPLRYYVFNNKHVSVRDKNAEASVCC